MTEATSTRATNHELDVLGGRLHYEVRGAGPLLLVIGQPMTSAPFGPLAELLAEDRTVVTYDPHGLGASSVDDPGLDVTPEVQADDLALLVGAVGGGPADVFASSGGAVAGLAFATRHPELVRTLIAHEPPVAELLPDAAHIRAAIDEIADRYRAAGSGAAWGGFVALVVHDGPLTEPGVPPMSWPAEHAGGGEDERTDDAGSEPHAGSDAGSGGHTDSDAGSDADAAPEAHPEPTAKQRADDELFFLRMLKPFTRYVPAVDALRAGPPRVLVAVGADSGAAIARRSAEALAELLQTPPVEFPGDHAGFMGDPAAFATRVREVLGG